ncbi:MAG TPA: hypothetical protein DDZ80_30335 [Cyanobacteria bacterium UBA8803]|nr:hypothetical protein [Cyanobacteria bacterium UBA9273]HBL62532.1 hypothetical protein [Cyanobacteria bacterium UBA8803]
MLSYLKRLSRFVLRHPALVASLTVTGLVVGARQLNLLEPLELTAYDRMMQLRPALPPDPRLLIVEITEADIQALEQWPMTDAVMNQLFQKLEQHQPAVIGLDIFRDIPVPPGHAELSARFAKSDRIIPICKLKDTENPGTPPPPEVPESRVGFSDLAIDASGTVRRALLFHHLNLTSGCTTPYSFSFQLARRYLEQKGIQPENYQDALKFGQSIFKPLLPNSGGYQQADAGGYQILLNYRSGRQLADTITLSEVLSDRLNPNLVKGRIILIGATAPSLKDAFWTPYSTQGRQLTKMSGVVVQGQIVSQILSTVLDGRRVFWFWPEWAEIWWIWGWSLAGGLLVRSVRNPAQLALAEILALSLLLGISVILFFGSGWVPVVAPSLGLIAGSTGVLAYTAYKTQQERAYFARLVQEQENNLVALQALLKEKTLEPAIAPEQEPLTNTTQIAPGDSTGDSTAIWNSHQEAAPAPTGAETPSKSTDILSGRYKIIRVLGAGGFGLTYLAEDTLRPGKPKCVVKHLQPARRDDKFLTIARRLFRTEAEILEKLGNHNQIPQLLAYFEENKEFYLVEEYVKGDSLSDELPVDKRLPEAQVKELIKGILEVLSFIHEHSVIHRDIKPSNIIRRQTDDKLVLIDFGAVKQIQPQELSDQENLTVAVGTRGYAPPEQYAGHPYFSSDIYAVGIIGIQAVTGIAPHQLSLAPETGEINWRHLANISEEFAQLLQKMVHYHFADRYQSASAVMEDLRRL